MRYSLRNAMTVAGLCAGAVLASAAVPAPALAATKKVTVKELSVKDQVLTDAKTSILAMATKSSPTDTMFLANGRFQYVGTECPRCELGPATAAAALYKRTSDKQMLTLATTVFDAAIKNQQQPNGSFTKGIASEGMPVIQTAFYAGHLGATLTYLGTSLDAGRRTTYKASLAKAADYLASSGMLTYYVNGNINLAVSEAFGLAWKLTGQTKYRDYFEKSMTFTFTPTGRWAEFGLRTSKVGKLSLGRDTAGYLGEKGAGAAGFDPEYAHFQADIASQAYVLLGDARFLALSNELNNQLWSRVNTSIWGYDIRGGSRQQRTTGMDRYTTPALWVGAVNGKPENKALALSQVRATTDLMRVSGTQAYAGIYQGWGSSFATLIATIQ